MGGSAARTRQLQGPRVLLLQKKSQKRRFREEADDEEPEAGSYPQYRGNCTSHPCSAGALTLYPPCWAAPSQLEQRSLLR